MITIFPKPHSIGVLTPLAVKNALHFLPVTPLGKIFLTLAANQTCKLADVFNKLGMWS